VEGFFKLLDELQVNKEDPGKVEWSRLLLDTVQSTEGAQKLSYPYWELLVELAVSHWCWLEGSTYNPQTIISLKEAEEWDKLEYWIGIVWMLWPPEKGQTTEGGLGHITLSLFHQQSGAIQKLEQWMEQWAGANWMQIPGSFQKICKQLHNEAGQL